MSDNISILIVDDDENFSKMISRELELSDYAVTCVTTGEEAIEQVRKTYFDIVLLDFKLPGMDGIDAIKVIKEENPHIEILMLTGHGTIDSAIASMKLGAYDYLTKPCRFDELENVLQKAYEKVKLTHRNVILEKELAKKNFSEEIVGESTAFGETVNMAVKVASTDCTVLIQGESGVGKELIAKLIHKNSPRKDKQFVMVDSTSLQEALLESELFGHEKGAFSGAYSLKHGLLEVADSGTLFLDEIGEISLAIQAKLLRVIETGTFRRVGGLKDIHVDVRIVAATNKDLMRMVEEKTFRDDLFYRLNVICISVPPLRNRKEDIIPLAEYFLNTAPNVNMEEKKISSEAMELLLNNHDWPGNIRELQNVVHRAVILSEDDQIRPADLPSNFQDSFNFTDESGEELIAPLEEIERRYIAFLLKRFNGHRGKVAKILKMSERNLYRKLVKLGLRGS